MTPSHTALPQQRTPGRPLVMGVVNVTPDSFSDGGQWFAGDAAVEHGRDLLRSGADLLDVGGESTRPGAERPSEAEEIRRVLPPIQALTAAGAVVSVDTMRAGVAAAALDAGAAIINDVSGGLADPEMVPLAAERQVPFIAMHWRGHSVDMQSRAVYDDVVTDVLAELRDRAAAITEAGVRDLVLDPGFGFAKTAQHNWALLAHMEALLGLGHPVLIGTSRKAFLGKVGREPGQERPPQQRDVATAATSLYAALHGAWAVRVHDVPSTVDALDVAEALRSELGEAR